jgi:hypothetical protein
MKARRVFAKAMTGGLFVFQWPLILYPIENDIDRAG